MAGSALIRLKVSALYLRNLFWPILLASIAFAYRPAETVLASVVALATFLLYATFDAAEFSDGRPDETFSKTSWLFCTMREYLQLTLHRTDEVQQKLIAVHPPTGQAIFSFFPHGVNSDFRVLMDGMMYDAFAKLYERAPARTLAASVLFKIPFVRKVSLATACVDAGRNTADKVIRNGRSVLVCPGGQDEQLETIYGRERVFLRKRSGFIRKAVNPLRSFFRYILCIVGELSIPLPMHASIQIHTRCRTLGLLDHRIPSRSSGMQRLAVTNAT